MIELFVQDYCNNCPDFDVEQETLHGEPEETEHYLSCKHEKICLRLYLRLREKYNELVGDTE